MGALRILQVHNAYQIAGGEDQVVASEAAMLRARGHRVEQYIVRNDDLRGARAAIRTGLEAAGSPSARRALAGLLARSRPDVVHVHNVFPRLTPSVYRATAEAGVATVQTLHNYRVACANALLFRDGRPCERCLGGSPLPALRFGCYRGSRLATLAAARYVRAMAAGALDRVERVIALSEFSRIVFLRAGLDPARLVVKPNFTEPDLEPRRTSAAPFALYAGRLSEEKGIEWLVRHWPRDALPLRIAGEGPLADRLRAGAGAGASPNVELCGRVPRETVRAWMREAVFAAVPSACYENFPMVVIEAYAAGLPVLAARRGALAELIDDGVTGRHFEPERPRDLARAITALVADDSIAAAARCRARHAERYGPDINGAQLEAIYADAMAGR